MKRKEISFILLGALLICGIFFYKMFLQRYLPFPGDLLISGYNPWKYDSFLGYAAGGYPQKGQYFDVLRQIYPWKTLSLQLLKIGQFPLWNPYNFSGTPLFANAQSAVLYPLNMLYLFFSQSIAWSMLVFLQPLLTISFTYFFLRKIKLSKIAALFSAVTFAFSSFLTVWLEYNTIGQVIAWLPLSLLAIEHLLEKRSKIWSLVFIFSLVAACFGGHIQIFGYSLVFILLYACHRINEIMHTTKGKKENVLFIIILLLFALGISSIQLFPTIELTSFAARSAHTFLDMFGKILMQPYQLIMALVPDFFGNPATRNYWLQDTYIGKMISIGIVPLLFVGVSLTQYKNSLVRFFLGTAVVVLLFVTANPLTYILYKLPFPFLLSSAPTLSAFLFCFAMSILAGFGIDYVRSGKVSKKSMQCIVLSLVSIFIVLWLGIFLLPKIIHADWIVNLAIAKRNLLYSTGIFVVAVIVFIAMYIRKSWVVGLLILLLVIQIADNARFFDKFNPFVSSKLVFPSNNVLTYLQNNGNIDRFYGFDNARIEANFATQYHIYSSEGYDPLYPKWYGEFIQSSQNGNIVTAFTDQTRSDATIASGFDQKNQARLRVLNLLGTKYILDRDENGSSEKTFPPSSFSLLFQQNGWKIFENKNALPRFFLSSDYQVYHSPKEFSQVFFNNNFNPLTTVLFDSDPGIHLDALVNTERVDLNEYTPNMIRFTTHTQGQHLLFLSDTYYPGWKATIDGKETPIYKTDYAFRSIVVPGGAHEVVFTFESASFKIGSIVSLVSLLIMALFLARYYEKVIFKK